MVKNTNRKMLLAIAMVLCAAMFVGSTFAWFTDSVSSGTNQIVAGNLDIELEHKSAATEGVFEKVDKNTTLFTDVEFWEPGVAVYETFQVSNKGTLALKYNFSTVISGINYVLNEDDTKSDKSLMDVLKIAVVNGEIGDETSRPDAIEKAKEDDAFKSIVDFGGKYGKLLPKDSKNDDGSAADTDIFTVILYWEPTDHDNDYNLSNGAYASGEEDADALYINLIINLVATQIDYEKDSFGDDYDASVDFPATKIESALPEEGIGNALAKVIEKKNNLNKLVFCVYTDELAESESLGSWADGIPFDADGVGYVRLFTKGKKSTGNVTAYVCVQPGTQIVLDNCVDMWAGFNQVREIDFGPKGLVSLANVTSLSNMFKDCTRLKTIDLSGLDVSNVTSMSGMFSHCTNLETVNLSGWDVSNVTSMYQMFGWCEDSLTTLDLSGWNVSNVTNMKEMFRACGKLTTIYAGDWTAYSEGSVGTDMFRGCNSLPGFESSKTGGAYATTIENGGYFTAK